MLDYSAHVATCQAQTDIFFLQTTRGYFIIIVVFDLSVYNVATKQKEALPR